MKHLCILTVAIAFLSLSRAQQPGGVGGITELLSNPLYQPFIQIVSDRMNDRTLSSPGEVQTGRIIECPKSYPMK